MTNCVNCGAILHGNKCEYCGTEYNSNCFQVNFDKNDYTGTMKLGNHEINVYVGSVEYNSIFSDSYSDEKGFLHRDAPKMIRKFTLIEI